MAVAYVKRTHYGYMNGVSQMSWFRQLTPTAGNLLLLNLTFYSADGYNVTVPPGWTQLTSYYDGNSSHYIMWKFSDGNDPDFSMSMNGSIGYGAGSITEWSGVHPTTPIYTHGSATDAANNSTVSVSGIVTTRLNQMAVYLLGGTESGGSETFYTPSGVTFGNNVYWSGSRVVQVDYEPRPALGAVPQRTWGDPFVTGATGVTTVLLQEPNVPPPTPTSLSPSGATGRTGQSLSAYVSDPDYQNVRAEFQVATDSGFTNLVGTYQGADVSGNGASSTYYFTGSNATTYWLRARAIDASGAASGWTAGQSFITNRPPSLPGVPSVTPSPVNANGTISWTAAVDPDPQHATVTYEVDLSTNGGSTWSNIRAWATGTSFVYDFTSKPSTSTAQLRVRARDAEWLTGAYATSTNFTIQHNQAPNAATWVGPPDASSLDRAQAQTLDWTFIDPDVGDTQSKYDLRYRLVGAGTWTTVTTVTTATDHTFAPLALAAGDYEFQVLTYDAQGVAATAWSAVKFLTFASQPGTPTVTAPANGATIGAPTGILAWSTGSQSSFQVRKLGDNAGVPDVGVVLLDTGEVISASQRDIELGFPVNLRTEHLQVRTRSSGLWSPWGSVKVLVSYTPPAEPTVRVSEGTRALTVVTVDGFRGIGQPAVSYHDVYRRVVGETGDGTRMATGMVSNQAWLDRSVAHRVDYEYRTVAVASNGTSTSSVWFHGRAFADLTPTFTT